MSTNVRKQLITAHSMPPVATLTEATHANASKDSLAMVMLTVPTSTSVQTDFMIVTRTKTALTFHLVSYATV